MKHIFPVFTSVRFLCLSFLLCLFYNESATAQKFTGKLILGLNGSQIDGDGMSGYHKPGLLAGAGVYFPISEQWTLGPEFCYSMKGSQTSSAQLELGYDRIIYKLNYIDLPIVATCRIRPNFAAMGGFQFSYLLNAKLDAGFNSTGFADANYLFKTMDYQIFCGIEYRVFGQVWFTGRVCYSVVSTNAVGLSNPNYGIWGTQTRGGFYNNLLQFSLRFRLFGGDKDTEQ